MRQGDPWHAAQHQGGPGSRAKSLNTPCAGHRGMHPTQLHGSLIHEDETFPMHGRKITPFLPKSLKFASSAGLCQAGHRSEWVSWAVSSSAVTALQPVGAKGSKRLLSWHWDFFHPCWPCSQCRGHTNLPSALAGAGIDAAFALLTLIPSLSSRAKAVPAPALQCKGTTTSTSKHVVFLQAIARAHYISWVQGSCFIPWSLQPAPYPFTRYGQIPTDLQGIFTLGSGGVTNSFPCPMAGLTPPKSLLADVCPVSS